MRMLILALVVLGRTAMAVTTFCSGVSTPIVPTQTVTPGDCTSTAAAGPVTPPLGVLLASNVAPWTTGAGTDSGVLTSAVYEETGGTLDFLYQISVNTTAPNCGGAGQPACDPIIRSTDTSFFGVATGVATLRDGGDTNFLGIDDPFVNGSVFPSDATRNASGSALGWDFVLADGNEINPGETSLVLVITTNATTFVAGSATVSDGGVASVSAFAPTAISGAPEPATFGLIGFGVFTIAIGSAGRRVLAARRRTSQSV